MGHVNFHSIRPCFFHPSGRQGKGLDDFGNLFRAMGWRTLVSRPDGNYYLPNVPHTRADYLEAVETAGFTLRQVLDVPVRDVPQGYLSDTLTRQEYDAALCLIILAQKPALK